MKERPNSVSDIYPRLRPNCSSLDNRFKNTLGAYHTSPKYSCVAVGYMKKSSTSWAAQYIFPVKVSVAGHICRKGQIPPHVSTPASALTAPGRTSWRWGPRRNGSRRDARLQQPAGGPRRHYAWLPPVPCEYHMLASSWPPRTPPDARTSPGGMSWGTRPTLASRGAGTPWRKQGRPGEHVGGRWGVLEERCWAAGWRRAALTQ